jgi:tetratricopeptide (TPR) repeat protein
MTFRAFRQFLYHRLAPALILPVAFAMTVQAQETRYYTDPLRTFNDAQDHFIHGEYSLAQPIFHDLRSRLRETERSNMQFTTEEIDFYTIVCGLKLNQDEAREQANSFIELGRSAALSQKMSYHLGEYYFRRQDMRNAILSYEQSDISQLSNTDIAAMKFHQGYGYFILQQFEKAKPLLNSVRQLKDDPNYLDANYYFGVIAFRDGNYADALDAFRKVEGHPQYGRVVPYYIASIYYIQGKKKEALAYAESSIGKGASLYDPELKQLMGHAYFESRQYEKAIPYLEQTVKGKASREMLYEVSYAYYATGKYAKSADGFKQLGGEQDSLGQSAMYLLGDAYLKMGQKSNARNAFSFCSANSSNAQQREVSRFNYGKLSYELGYQDIALNELKIFIDEYPQSIYNKEARELLVSLLANTNNYREAMAMLGSVKDPSENTKNLYGKVAFGRAMELINDGDLQGADELLGKALASSNSTTVTGPSNFWKGEIAYRQNRTDDAVKYYNAFLSAPASAAGEATVAHAQYNLGYCYLRKENYKAAQTFFEPLSKGASFNANEVVQDAYLRSADCSFMNKDFAKAKTQYANAIAWSWPAADYATYQMALIAGVGNSAEKLNLLRGFETKFPNSELLPSVNMEIANTYMGDEKFKEALPYLGKVVKANENTGSLKPRALLKQGIAYFNLDNNREALASYKKLIADYPNAPEADEALENAKAIYVEEGKTSEYADFMRSANRTVTRDQEDSLAWAAAESRYTSSDQNAALSSIDAYLKKYPDGQFHQDAEYMRAGIYGARKDAKNAAAAYAALADEGAGKYLERSAQEAGRIYYFDLQDYPQAEKYFSISKSVTGNREQRLDAMRGLLRSQYQQKKWTEAEGNAQELLREKSISTDDKALAGMVIAQSLGSKGKYGEAQAAYRDVVAVNKAALGAEARYRIAESYYLQQDWKNAEKAAMETINKSGSYDYWITRAYILLGDIFTKQKDWFNAKATLKSVVDNSRITDLKIEAQEKLDAVVLQEKGNNK